LLRKNVNLLEATGALVQEADALNFIRSDSRESFDVVFLDPPFADDLLEDLCRLLAGSGKLNAGARIYLEQERDKAAPLLPAGWKKQKEKTAGNVRYSLVEA
jgi:16S rRNA (guanine966-N2)-methyltransferase